MNCRPWLSGRHLVLLACVRGQPIAGDQQLRTLSSFPTPDRLDLTPGRTTCHKPGVFGGRGLYTGLGLAYALAPGDLPQATRAILAERTEGP
jgi:hypothetical protein